MTELIIPPAVFQDKDSFEILRVWAANDEQHVTISSDLNGGAEDFGYMLAQLAYHGAKLYSEKSGESKKLNLEQILKGFTREIEENTGNPNGQISQ